MSSSACLSIFECLPSLRRKSPERCSHQDGERPAVSADPDIVPTKAQGIPSDEQARGNDLQDLPEEGLVHWLTRLEQPLELQRVAEAKATAGQHGIHWKRCERRRQENATIEQSSKAAQPS
mmetsp:Transcript_31511/g.55825  ORF Transcript_31511/g.55825 Transcript_31511/m.55825 type:complete len:121 (-) Transcript_31511:468-830(-)